MACKCPRFNRRLNVQRLKADAVVDDAGHVDESLDSNWETYTNVWAAVVAKSSREFWGADQVEADITHQITMRFNRINDAIQPEMRAKDGSRIYNLSSAPYDPDGLRKQLKINAVEVR
jgi:SPP1 family predicted phage head-tail adaptor